MNGYWEEKHPIGCCMLQLWVCASVIFERWRSTSNRIKAPVFRPVLAVAISERSRSAKSVGWIGQTDRDSWHYSSTTCYLGAYFTHKLEDGFMNNCYNPIMDFRSVNLCGSVVQLSANTSPLVKPHYLVFCTLKDTQPWQGASPLTRLSAVFGQDVECWCLFITRLPCKTVRPEYVLEGIFTPFSLSLACYLLEFQGAACQALYARWHTPVLDRRVIARRYS